MPESDEERRLRKQKRREAARRAGEAEEDAQFSAEVPPPVKTLSPEAATTGATGSRAATTAPSGETHLTRKETEEERRIRKEKKRAQREAQKQQEAAAAATAVAPPITEVATPTAKSPKEERRAVRERSCHGNEGVGDDGMGKPSAKKSLADDVDAALLSAIEAENIAVVEQSVTNSRNFAAAELKRATEEKERKRLESAEERAERKRAEREARRRLRHAAATGAGECMADDEGRAPGADAAGRVGPSPVTAFDPGELQRQAYRAQFQKDLARATLLRRMIDFDSSGGVVLDLAPQSAYDLYIRDFCQTGREQVGVQAPPEEERMEVGTQAERCKLRARGTQAPDDLGLCPEEEAERQFFQLRRKAMQRSGKDSGAGAADEEEDRADGREDGGEVAGKPAAGSASVKTRSLDAAMLERFLANTLPVMIAALDESDATASGTAAAAAAMAESSKPKTSTGFSCLCTTFCWHCTRNRPVVQVLLNPLNPRQLVALHGTASATGPSATLDTFLSVLLLWNVHDAAAPERVFVSCSEVTCMCISPSRPHLLYGGTADGNACIWNLRESERLHLSAGRYERAVFQLPSYSTGWQVGGHAAPVRQVRVAGYNSFSRAIREEEKYEQVISMDEIGAICYWALAERRDPSEANSGGLAAAAAGLTLHDNDYGLHPGSGVSLRLTKGSVAAAATATPALRQEGEDGDAAVAYSAGVAGDFDLAPSDGSQLVLTAPHGVVRCSRIGGIASPCLYGPSCSSNDLPYSGVSGEDSHCTKAVAVPCCVQYGILDTRWFVVGYEDGTVRLYLQDEAAPQVTVEVGNQPIVAVRCSGVIPWVVWALDESGELHLIDFAYHRRQAPRLSHTLTQPETGRCTCIDLPSKSEKADQHILVAGFEKGMVQVHAVDVEKLRVANSERNEQWL
ncbi:hypothetical protein LSCM1_06788 [Leishmania martiniquensis]|uniref:Uncharacterized protein n=1 Tax=Leishmania martiniquensis TaxID=1580590 RepID=A0A836GFM8_9TRYP|nr:hypothetical protein LSCM1_06788 [Leishmania martiniquensis]